MALVAIIFIGVRPLSGTGGRWMEDRMFWGRSERSVMYLGKLCAILAVVGI